MENMRFGALVAIVVIGFFLGAAEAGNLTVGFYNKTCPTAESVVRQAVIAKFNKTFITAPGTLRLFFHDCASTGCNAAVLITKLGGGAERDDPDNANVAGDGYDTIIQAKKAVESVCPGVVTCADIMAMAARDAVVLTGGPSWAVELGRFDAKFSNASDVHLPKPTDSVDSLNASYAKMGLNTVDMVALSGAHTIGFVHCTQCLTRLYNFSASHTVDPSLNSTCVAMLKAECPKDVDPAIATILDHITDQKFDNKYYVNLENGCGVLPSDSILFSDNRTEPIVRSFANNQTLFFEAFKTAMIKLGRFNVLNSTVGEIRKDCTQFLSSN